MKQAHWFTGLLAYRKMILTVDAIGVAMASQEDNMANHIKRFQDLDTYKRAFAFQQEIFRATKSWPKEEQYALTDQVRRSSLRIPMNSDTCSDSYRTAFRSYSDSIPETAGQFSERSDARA